jgi:uncharacterized protein GlcG (DUF336 family)
MSIVRLADAEVIVAAALDDARARNLQPLGITVLDAGGHVVLAKREDHASLFRLAIAEGKAKSALGMGYGTRELARRPACAQVFYAGVMAITGEIVPSPGGVLIRNADGTLIGAIGVSGDTGDNDEAIAVAGIAAAGLTAQPDERTP